MSDYLSARSDYVYFSPISTRWMDNDIYGHVNNVTYYSYFDTVANEYLMKEGGLDIHAAEVVGFVVASSCQYNSPIAYPDKIEAGFRVNKLGNRSVEYGVAIFKAGDEAAAACGTFTHVFVNRKLNQAVAIPDTIRTALEAAMVGTG